MSQVVCVSTFFRILPTKTATSFMRSIQTKRHLNNTWRPRTRDLRWRGRETGPKRDLKSLGPSASTQRGNNTLQPPGRSSTLQPNAEEPQFSSEATWSQLAQSSFLVLARQKRQYTPGRDTALERTAGIQHRLPACSRGSSDRSAPKSRQRTMRLPPPGSP